MNRDRLKRFIGTAFLLTGADRIYYRLIRRFFSPGFVVALMYHRVCPDENSSSFGHSNSVLRRQIELLRERFDPMTEEELLEFLDGKRSLRRPGFFVSFDDGYANNEETLLWCAGKGVFPTVFLAAEWIGTRHTLPINLVNMISLQNGHDPDLVYQEFRDMAEEGGLGNAAIMSLERREGGVSSWYKSLSAEDAERLLAVLIRRHAVLWDHPNGYEMMSWETVRNLSSIGIRFGSHGRRHHIMSNLPEGELDGEAAMSRSKIEKEIRKTCSTFAYPNGKHGDFPSSAVRAVAGQYRMAFTAVRGVVRRGADRFRLPRFGPPENSLALFLADLFLLCFRT